ncbi:MAG TPA: hypothetical protein VGT02_05090 [Methylomirabilota bacterium]|nr:hypothetical protein [Methylomirabilota bacterium]
MIATAPASFPLCPNPAHHDAVRRVVDGCARFLRDRLADRLVALVLTGSFSRGEGTVLPLNGRLRVLGDIEFLVVVPRLTDYRALRRRVGAWGREASAQFGAPAVAVEIEFGPVEIGYLRHRARPSIFVYDLATHGKVVWGPPDLLAAIPPFGAEGIPREDALHLVFNRMIEQLDAYDRLDGLGGDALLDVAYQRVKLVLDLAGSALAFSGTHATSYAERPVAFARLLARTPRLAARLPAGFEDELERAARAKLDPGTEPLLPDDHAGAQRAWLRRRIVEGVPSLTAFLVWELEELTGGRAPLNGLLREWMTAEPVRRRLREWARLALHPNPAPLPLSPRRALALARRSTPRALLYAAGALAYADLPRAGERGQVDVSPLLPLAGRFAPRTPTAARRAVTALWRWCIRNN